jgi:hypothetical protein
MTNFFLLLTIFLLPLQFALNVGENFDLVTTRVLVPLLFLFWLARSLVQKKIWIPNKAETWFILVFLFLSLLSLFLGRDASSGIRKYLYFLTVFPVFFVAADVFREEKWRKRGALAVVASGMAAALIALSQFLLPFFVGIEKSVKIWEGLAPHILGNSLGKLVAANSSWLVNIGGETWMRAFGLFPDPHNFAFFLNLCLLFGLGYFFWQKKTATRSWLGMGLAVMTASALLSFSRGGYLGLIAGLVFFLIILLKRVKLIGRVFLVVGLIFSAVFLFNSSVVSKRLVSSFSLKEGSNAERYRNWTEAAEIIKEYPLVGVGLGNYARTIDPASPDRTSIYAHNLFLDIAAETGILNALVFALLLVVSIWRNASSSGTLRLGIASGLVAFSVHSIFDTALYAPQVLVLFLIIIAMGPLSEKRIQNENGKKSTQN